MCKNLKCGAIQGINKKFTVLKDEDILKYLGKEDRETFNSIITKIINARKNIDGKESDNTYFVINTDEPYADEVKKIMKEYGHIS